MLCANSHFGYGLCLLGNHNPRYAQLSNINKGHHYSRNQESEFLTLFITKTTQLFVVPMYSTDFLRRITKPVFIIFKWTVK